MENKMEIKPIMAYNFCDVLDFMFFKKFGVKYEGGEEKMKMDYWNKCNSDFGNEIMNAAYKMPDEVEIKDSSEMIFKIVVSKIAQPILKEFTSTYNLTEDYLIIFLD